MSAKPLEKKRSVGKTVGKVIGFTLAGLVAAVLTVFLVMMYVIPAFETVDRTPEADAGDWMAALADELTLSEVVLPGTHDSASKNVDLAFFSKCQELTVKEQLEAGYRYLDVRLAMENGRLKLMHGFVTCRTGGWPFSGTLYLDEILADCYRFLEEHPQEILLFAVKQEHGNEPVVEFENCLNAYVSKDRSHWLLSDCLPTVGEARGKIVLLRRYSDRAELGKESGISYHWTSQDDRTGEQHTAESNNGTYTLWVQDRYKYDAEEKWKAFLSGLEAAPVSENEVAVHFLSTNGSVQFGHPHQYAVELNEKFRKAGNDWKGWIILDFGTSEMAALIYRQNFPAE